MTFGEQLKRLRQENDLSQEQMAKAIFVSRQTVSNWENAKSYPDLNNLVALSTLFDTTIDILVKGEVDQMKNVRAINNYKRVTIISTLFLVLGVGTMIVGRRMVGEGFSIAMGIMILLIVFMARIQLKKIRRENQMGSPHFDFRTADEILFVLENPGISEEARANKKQKLKMKNLGTYVATIVLFALYIVFMAYLSKKFF